MRKEEETIFTSKHLETSKEKEDKVFDSIAKKKLPAKNYKEMIRGKHAK